MKNNKKGFTLAELLIVVAIIAVLVAIAIPVFTTQLEKAREATDAANLRAAYAEAATSILSEETFTAKEVAVTQKKAKWNGVDSIKIGDVDVTVTNLNGWIVAVDTTTNKVTITEKTA